ncbi:MAG: hypothetical protein WBH97_04965 [Rectinemataceae bacterium]
MDTKVKPSKAAKVEEKTFVQKLSEYVRKHRKILIAISAVIVAAVLAIGIYSVVSNSRAEKAAEAMETARTNITAWSGEADEAKKTELKTALVAELETLAKKWPRTFSAQEALFAKAGISLQDKDYEGAESGYLAAADRLPKTYLAPIALEAAAIAAEERGAADKAVEYYGRIVANYKELAPNTAHAYFSLGRLAEGRAEWSVALENYEKLSADHPDSDWTKLAKDRIIFIKASGLVK